MSERGPEDGLMYVAPSDPPPSRRAPRGTVGAVGWMRQNLFNGPINTILTFVMLALVFLGLRELVTWSIQDAQWGVINNNLRLFNIGRYPVDEIWRIELLALLLMFLSGIGLAIWGGASRNFFLTVGVVVVTLILVPIAADQIEPASLYYIVEEDEFYGPQRFVGDEGDIVEISVVAMNRNSFAAEDNDPIRGLLESAPGANSSRLAWSTIKRSVNDDLEDRREALAEADAGQEEAVRAEFEPTVFENYNLLIDVQLLDADGEIVAETFSVPNDPNVTLEVELPEDGWYIVNAVVLEGQPPRVDTAGLSLPRAPFRKSTENTGVAFIRLDGVEIYNVRPDDIEERTDEYGPIPDLEALDTVGECYSPDPLACQTAEAVTTFNGDRTVAEYVRLQLGPYMNAVGGPVIIGIVVFLLAYLLGYYATQSTNPLHLKTVNRFAVLGWLGMFPISWLVLGGSATLTALSPGAEFDSVDLVLWEGLLLTLILTFISVFLSFPLGILLALGRRSGLPVIGTFCVVFIEVIRGAPLITILFFAKNIIPFFAEGLTELEDVLRMLVGLTLFSAAYQAEIVRGGLQIIPKGQTEAAQALGLNNFYTNTFIIMPQALRAVIPASMSQFVSLFKDTSLVQIIGLFELIGIAEIILNGQQRYRLAVREAYLYIGAIYFMIAFIMSAISRRLEETGSGSTRR